MADVVLTAADAGDDDLRDAGDDDLRELHGLLAGEAELRGRVAVRGGPPVPGTMGAVTEAVTIALGPGGAGTAIAAVVITYLRQRGRSLRLRVTRADGASVDLMAGNVRGLDAQAVRVQVADLARFLDAGAPAGPRDGAAGTASEERASLPGTGPGGVLEP